MGRIPTPCPLTSLRRRPRSTVRSASSRSSGQSDLSRRLTAARQPATRGRTIGCELRLGLFLGLAADVHLPTFRGAARRGQRPAGEASGDPGRRAVPLETRDRGSDVEARTWSGSGTVVPDHRWRVSAPEGRGEQEPRTRADPQAWPRRRGAFGPMFGTIVPVSRGLSRVRCPRSARGGDSGDPGSPAPEPRHARLSRARSPIELTSPDHHPS